MNDKEKNVDHVLNQFESSLDIPIDNESFLLSSSKRLISSSRERRSSNPVFSSAHEVGEEACNLIAIKSPRESSRPSNQANNYNIDGTSSTYALQISLKNMKERYQRLQKKLSVLEEENGRLIHGKSELFNEIGKLQESSIKLREKNLQLNHEVHSKHQECCSLKDQFSSMSKENLHLTTQLSQSMCETNILNTEMEELAKENTLLKQNLEDILSLCHNSPSLSLEFLGQLEKIANMNGKRCHSTDLSPKVKKRFPNVEGFEVLADFEKVTDSENCYSNHSKFGLGGVKANESQSRGTLLKAQDTMQKVLSILHFQKQQLNDLHPLLQMVFSKRKWDSSEAESEGDRLKNQSCFAICGSLQPPSATHFSSEEPIESVAIDSVGETNVLVEEVEGETNCSKIPFDWRKVEVSEGEDDSPQSPRRSCPKTRTVSTSPDHAMIFNSLDDGWSRKSSRKLSSEEDRTCPMCHAVFPLLLPQETFESHVVRHFEEGEIDIEMNS